MWGGGAWRILRAKLSDSLGTRLEGTDDTHWEIAATTQSRVRRVKLDLSEALDLFCTVLASIHVP